MYFIFWGIKMKISEGCMGIEIVPNVSTSYRISQWQSSGKSWVFLLKASQRFISVYSNGHLQTMSASSYAATDKWLEIPWLQPQVTDYLEFLQILCPSKIMCSSRKGTPSTLEQQAMPGRPDSKPQMDSGHYNSRIFNYDYTWTGVHGSLRGYDVFETVISRICDLSVM